MKIKNIGHSRKVRLLALLAHDNKKYQQILIRYFHERDTFMSVSSTAFPKVVTETISF